MSLDVPTVASEHVPKALFGEPLLGNAPVRFIYVDEAGTSEVEPVSVVVGIIVHADTQWLPAARMVQSLRPTIPTKFQNDIFHAKTIWGDTKYRPDWSMEARIEFLCRLMSIPNRAGMAVSWAMTKRDARIGAPPGYTQAQAQHAYAFANCLSTADTYIREQGAPGELATVVAEDVPKMRDFLRFALGVARYKPNVVTDELSSQPIALHVTQVVDEVHFASKTDAILLQVVDACAFALRRYLSNQSHGETFALAVTGGADPGKIFGKDQSVKSAGGMLSHSHPTTSPPSSSEPSAGRPS